MELKIFRDTLPQAGTSCTVKAELPLETEILISDYLPPVFKLVKCFAKPVVLQKAAAARAAYIGRLSALHCVLSGRGRGRALPDRAEAAVYKAAGGAGIFLHQLDGHGRRAD